MQQGTGTVRSYIADGAVSRFTLVKETSTSALFKAATAGAGEKSIGIALEDAADGATVRVLERGLGMLRVNAATNASRSGATLTGGAAAIKATGSILFGANPSAGHTIDLNGVSWEFVASGATGNQTNIAGTLALTLAQLVIDLNGSADTDIDDATYSEDDTSLLIEHDTAGTGGNAFTLAASNATVSAATLTGGAAAVAATGYITALQNPVPGDVWTINGVAMTWVASGAGANEINIGATLDLSGAAAATKLNAHASGSITPVTYAFDADTDRLNMTHDTPGTGGNSFTLAVSSMESSIAVGDPLKAGAGGYAVKADDHGDHFGATAKLAATGDAAVIPVRVERGYVALAA